MINETKHQIIFLVFNVDYYAKNFISTLGEATYIGDSQHNQLRQYLQFWWWLNEINQCKNEHDFFKTIFKNIILWKLVDTASCSPFLNWYNIINKMNLNNISKEEYKNIINLSKKSLINLKDKKIERLRSIKIVNFINNCYKHFKDDMYNIPSSKYDDLIVSEKVKHQVNESVQNWVFWKLVFIYQLNNNLEVVYDQLPTEVQNHHSLCTNFNNNAEFHKLYNLLKTENNNLMDDELNRLIQLIGLGYKYKILNGKVVHRSNSTNVSHMGESENKLLAFCYFISRIKDKTNNFDQDYYIVIDDPINSMDNNYTLNVIRLIIELIMDPSLNNLKWIILSHNYNFCDGLLFRLHQENKSNSSEQKFISSKLFYLYLDETLSTKMNIYNSRFNTAIKRIISDIWKAKLNPRETSLINVCNKIRILLEVYSSIYSGTMNHFKLITNSKYFDKQDYIEFQNIMDILNNYSHGRSVITNSFQHFTSSVTKTKIIDFAIKLIKVYSPFILERLQTRIIKNKHKSSN